MGKTRTTLDLLKQFESRNVTFIEPDYSWPIVWDRASGTRVWDIEGREYLDLTAAFGVAAAGHANPRVVAAAIDQLRRLPHAMGDVHPHPLKARLARELSHLTFERWTRSRESGKTIFCNSGFEAVEAALKTARLATGKAGIIAFEGGYHGLGYGALNATHRDHFRGPFRNQIREFGTFLSFPLTAAELRTCRRELHHTLAQKRVGALLVEPIQARGGIRVPHPDFLPLLAESCRKTNTLLILDEVYTGFGRTGRWFACEHAGVVPDLVCLGKALTGGFPLSVCVGKSGLMDAAWPPSNGEAIHTSTFLGNPVGCAMALAQIKEIERLRLVEKSAERGKALLDQLRRSLPGSCLVRGVGLMAGVELVARGVPDGERAIRVMKHLLAAGFIVIPEGEVGSVIGLTPPLTMTRAELSRAVRALARAIRDS
jgi:4-aminobutyrate aminotransferase-like enzyme